MDDLRADLHHSARRDSGAQRLLRRAAAGKGRPLRLTRKMHAGEAFRAILSDCLIQATAQAGILRDGRSVEALHQLRVALRKLEVALDAFGAAFGQGWFAELRGRAKAISARLSPARDLDVFLEELWPAALGKDGDFPAFRRAAEAARDRAWTAVESCVTSEDFSHLMDDIAALSQSHLVLGDDRKLTKVARELLGTAAKRVEKRGRRARSRGEADLHRLRIGLKKLRYLAQMFAPLYRSRRSDAYLAAIRRLQDELGALNDIAHARALVAGMLRDGDAGAIGYGAGMLTGYYAAGRARRSRKALKRYRDFKEMKRFWKG